MRSPIRIETIFDLKVAAWYDKWLEWETFQGLGESGYSCHRFPVVGGRFLGWCELFFDGPLFLEDDPTNEFDGKAIKVLYHDHHVGWVPRDKTCLFHGVTFHQSGGLKSLPKVFSDNTYIYTLADG